MTDKEANFLVGGLIGGFIMGLVVSLLLWLG